MKAGNLSNQCDFCSEGVLSDLCARSATHLQLLPLKLKGLLTFFGGCVAKDVIVK